jgi:hypothetical protein
LTANSFVIFIAGIIFSIVLDKLILKSKRIYAKTVVGKGAIICLAGSFFTILASQEDQSPLNLFLVVEFIILYFLQISISKSED